MKIRSSESAIQSDQLPLSPIQDIHPKIRFLTNRSISIHHIQGGEMKITRDISNNTQVETNRFERLKNASPEIFTILRSANTLERARERAFQYVCKLDRELHEGIHHLHPLEWANAIECLQVFKGILSRRNEQLTGESSLKYLWMIAHDNPEISKIPISNGFIEEFIHLLKGIHGKSGLYNEKKPPEFLKLEGRQAAKVRSDNLDLISQWAESYLQRYKSGLDKDIMRLRQKNVQRIIRFFKADEKNWDDWHWHIRHIIKNADTLTKLMNLNNDFKKAVSLAVKNRIPFGITPYYLSLMSLESDADHDMSIRSQVIPPIEYIDQMITHKDEYTLDCDFMLERDTSPIDLVTRRYPKVAIFKPYNTCPQICVYCQRNWEIDEVNAPDALASPNKIDAAIKWFDSHPEVTEVLITGGDPFALGDKHIEYFLRRFSNMPHIERIRFGTRTPVTIPQRITDSLVSLLKHYNNPKKCEVCIITHFQHVSEITPESFNAVRKLKDSGISLYNQLVYTFYVSRRFESMALRKLLKRIGVDPYYTFNTKGKQELQHYRVPIARLLQERREEVRMFPGTERLDEPVYNVPRLGKNYLKAWQNHEVIMITSRGTRIYEFHPWEKGINPVDTYITEDVSIYKYLQELKKTGEDIRDYKSIWYYF